LHSIRKYGEVQLNEALSNLKDSVKLGSLLYSQLWGGQQEEATDVLKRKNDAQLERNRWFHSKILTSMPLNNNYTFLISKRSFTESINSHYY